MMLHDALEFRIPYVWLEGLAGTGRTLLNCTFKTASFPGFVLFGIRPMNEERRQLINN